MAVSLEKIQRWVKRKNSKKIINVLNDDDYETRINAIRALSNFNSLDVI
ncbi:MAG: HEAT repeat domain-containing protein, partial [Clostridiaceae bacterium]|nr:HEAT repeat domain-containing protein [Clostridiaceae bacterium]